MSGKIRLFGSLVNAWELLLDYPLPKSWRNSAKDGGEPSPYLTMLALPVVGLIVALLLLLFWKVCTGIFHGIGPAMLFAVAATLLLDCKDSGRGQSLLVTVISAAMRNVRLAPLLPQLRAPHLNDLVGAVPVAALVLLELFKLWGFFMLARYGAVEWIVAVLVLPFTVQGYLAPLRNLNGKGEFLAVLPAQQPHIWMVAVFLMLFLALGMAKAALVATAVAFLLALLCRNWYDRMFGGVTAELITLTGAVAELAVLLIGLLFAV